MPSALLRACAAPRCAGLATHVYCPIHSPKRYVITGPPNCGKSTWVRQQATDGDLVWDFDRLASVLSLDGRERPRAIDDHSRGAWPWPTMKAMLVMRDALMAWLADVTLHEAAVYVIVRDGDAAVTIARQIGAQIVEPTGEYAFSVR